MKLVRELRGETGLTQKAFADEYGIPVSTLRKWEQGEASPPEYVIRLLAKAIPEDGQVLQKVGENSERVFYYNPGRNSVLDSRGNEIPIREELQDVNKHNLQIYLEDLFDSYYEIQEKFNRDCYYDKREGIIWSR